MVPKILFLIAADQITKALLSRDFFVKNYGLPFGFDLGKFNFLILIVAGIFLTVYFIRARSSLDWLSKLGFSFIFAGAISNLIDRLMFGYVRDFISVKISTFNLADVFIIIGLIVVIFTYEPVQKNFRN